MDENSAEKIEKLRIKMDNMIKSKKDFKNENVQKISRKIDKEIIKHMKQEDY